MTKKQKEERQRELDRRNAMYAAAGNHQPTEREWLMAASGHPCATAWRTLLDYYNTLRYASNVGARFLAYKDGDEYAQMDKPLLRVADFEETPKGYPWGGRCYEDRAPFIEACIQRGFPPETLPSFAVSFSVYTTDYNLVGDLFKITKGRSLPQQEKRGGPWSVYLTWVHDLGECQRIVKAISKYMRKWLLDPRTAADDVWDRAPLDLPSKALHFAGVREVTVTDQTVLVPGINVSDPEGTLRTANSLVNLCRQGYPYAGPVRDYLVKSIHATTVKQLDKEFRYRPVTA